MNKLKKIIAAAASAVLVLILMCGCGGSDNSEYDYLKTEIVGMWMDEGGPVVDTDNPFGKSLRFYEFTSTGEVYHHFVFMNTEMGVPSDGAMQTSTYYFDGNMLVNVAGSEENGDLEKTGALIEINGNTMTMSNNSGSTNYTKLSVEDATGYCVSYKDEALYEKQQELINNAPAIDADEAESEGAETEASGETASESAESETEASEETASESTEE
ncbi:MAG: hypothetical protein MR038_00625 [Oscillospiraceae bacterium]|nr:hypothetical protein [Oscillospiraceae bacterium]